MNRRELLSALIGLGTAATVKAAERPGAPVDTTVLGDRNRKYIPARKYGLLTVDGHCAHRSATGEDLHVWVDGVELTSVVQADDIEGYADIFCQDQQSHRDWTAKGAIHLNLHSFVNDACKLRVPGHVVIAPGVTR